MFAEAASSTNPVQHLERAGAPAALRVTLRAAAKTIIEGGLGSVSKRDEDAYGRTHGLERERVHPDNLRLE